MCCIWPGVLSSSGLKPGAGEWGRGCLCPAPICLGSVKPLLPSSMNWNCNISQHKSLRVKSPFHPPGPAAPVVSVFHRVSWVGFL